MGRISLRSLASILSFLTMCNLAIAETLLSDDEYLGHKSYVVEWASGNRSVGELPISLRRLVLALYNVGQLPLASLEADKATYNSPERLVRERIPFLEWTDEIDNMLCDLNLSHCTRRRVEVPAAQFASLEAHVGGFRITPESSSKWSLQPGDRIFVPSPLFHTTSQWQVFQLQTTNLRAVYETEALGCEPTDAETFLYIGTIDQFRKEQLGAADTTCVRQIVSRNLLDWAALAYFSDEKNPDNRLDVQNASLQSLVDLSDKALASLDTASAWSELNLLADGIYSGLPSPSLAQVQLPVFSLSASVEIGGQPFSVAYDASLSRELAREVATLPPSDIVNRLSSSIDLDVLELDPSVYVGRADTSYPTDAGVTTEEANFHYSTSDADANQVATMPSLQKKQIDAVLRAINVWTKGPPFLKDNRFPRSIIIVDDGLDTHHCIFTGNCKAKWVDQTMLDNPSTLDREMVDALKVEIERMGRQGTGHGLGVAAVAAANPASGALAGIDPQARTVPFELNLNGWATEKFGERAGKLIDELGGTFTVWNISGHTSSSDRMVPIDRFVNDALKGNESLPSTPYFVVAAGNVSPGLVQQDLDNEACTILPACRGTGSGTKPIITVVGAMLDDYGVPVLWTKDDQTTYSNPKFEIAAMAKGVVIPSLTTSAFFAVDGTSYAAPQVSSVLLLLRSQLMFAPPQVIIGRIVGCGRMSKALEGHVMGGLLDAACTLRFTDTQVAYEPGEDDDTDRDEARRLRPGKLLGVWNVDGKPVELLPVGDEDTTTNYRWWPEDNRSSIAGFRRLVDDPDSFNLTTWDRDGELSSRVRGAFDSSQVLEILFEGDTNATCIEARQLLGYVPGAPSMVSDRDQISESDSRCRPNGTH